MCHQTLLIDPEKPVKPPQLHDVLMGVLAKNPIQENDLPTAKNEMQTSRFLLAEDNVSSQKVTLAILSDLDTAPMR